jgi:anti-anti-sigma factor
MSHDVELGDEAARPADQLTIGVVRQDRTVILEVAGELDMLTAPQLETAAAEVLADHPQVLIIDLTGVRLLASAGLSVLVHASRLAAEDTRFGVVATGRVTRWPLDITGLGEVFAIYETRADALAG